MNTSLAIPEDITIEDLVTRAGRNLSDPRVVFKGDVYDGTLANARNPKAAIEGMTDAIMSQFEITDVSEGFPGMTADELAIALFEVQRRSAYGKPQPISNDPTVVPGVRRVPIGYDWETGELQHMTVPKGEISLPGFSDQNLTGGSWQPSIRVIVRGGTPYLMGNILRADQDAMQGIFEFVRDWANTHSIYLGQVVDQSFNFVKMTNFNPRHVALTDKIRNSIDLFVRGPLEFPDANTAQNIPPKTGLFLYGPPGGGKTMIKSLCAYIAARAGACVVDVHPESGAMGFNYANEMTKRLLLQGHKVMICMEDMEKTATEARATMLEILDGGDTKHLRRICVGTSNFIETIDRAMLRPGRFDGVEECDLPDLAAFKMLVPVLLPGKDLSQIDFEAAFEHFEGYTYAFIANAVQNIIRAAVIRTKGNMEGYVLTTEDLIAAAKSVRGHFELLQTEVEVAPPVLDQLYRDIVEEQIEVALDQRNFSNDVDYDYLRDMVRETSSDVMKRRLEQQVITDHENGHRHTVQLEG